MRQRVDVMFVPAPPLLVKNHTRLKEGFAFRMNDFFSEKGWRIQTYNYYSRLIQGPAETQVDSEENGLREHIQW